MSQKGAPSDFRRLFCLAIFVFSLFFLLVFRFYRIQIIEGERWTKEGQAQSEHVVIEPFMRGSFFSNPSVKEGHPEFFQPFAMDIPKFHLYIDPEGIPENFKKEMVKEFSALFPFSSEEKKKIEEAFFRKSRSRRLLSWLEQNQREDVQEWWSSFSSKRKIPQNVLFFIKEYKRSYPFGVLLGPVLHTVQDERDPQTKQQIPTGGLELYFHPYLQGKFGKRVILRSLRHPLDMGTVVESPENGADVYLTINHYLQAIAEEELEKGVLNVHAKGGWAVMMQPDTGEILALAQYPFFDVSKYRDFFNDPSLQERTKIKAVTDAFEPGSVCKPLALAVCLQANEDLIKENKKPLFSPSEKVFTGNWKFPGTRTFAKDTHLHHYLNMYQGIQKSSNIYIFKMVERVLEKFGEEWYREKMCEMFHFGQKTGIEIPGETLGLFPKVGKLHANGKLEWSAATPYMIADGHNVLINSIQLTRGFAILANGGYDVTPTIVRKISRKHLEGGEEILFERKLSPRKRLFSPSVIQEMVKAMKYVTKIGGTSRRGDIPGYTEAGKSGTSEKIVGGKYSKKNYISSFVGFAPAKNPKFVLLIVVDEPEVKYIQGVGKIYHGGTCASPIFREIGRRTLEYLGTVPDDPHGYPYGDPRRKGGEADYTKEVSQLNQLYQTWNGAH